jgi:hypothetical protein
MEDEAMTEHEFMLKLEAPRALNQKFLYGLRISNPVTLPANRSSSSSARARGELIAAFRARAT